MANKVLETAQRAYLGMAMENVLRDIADDPSKPESMRAEARKALAKLIERRGGSP